MVAFLLSPGDYITGTSVTIDGALSLTIAQGPDAIGRYARAGRSGLPHGHGAQSRTGYLCLAGRRQEEVDDDARWPNPLGPSDLPALSVRLLRDGLTFHMDERP